MQNTLWPGDDPAVSVRVAVVAGRVRSCPSSLPAAAKTVPSRAICSSVRRERAGASLVAGGGRDLPAADDVEQVREVHVHAEGQRGVAAGQPARCDEDVVHGRDAEPAELLGDRRGEVAALLDHGEAVEGEARVAVVGGGLRADLVCECLGERDEALAGLGSGCQLERHVASFVGRCVRAGSASVP